MAWEDLDIDHRLAKKGYEFRFNPKALVYHYRTATLKKFMKMMFNYGRAQGFLVKTYGPFRFVHYVPLLLAAAAGFCLMAGVKVSLLLSLILGAVVFIYFLFKTRLVLKTINYICLLLVTLIFWNTGFIKELIVPGFRINKANS